MRDNHESLPEIISAHERDGHFFCLIGITIETEMKAFEFGINEDSYKAIKQILDLRPFEKFPGAKYSYFFSPSVRREATNLSKTYCSIRIEQGNKGKEIEVAAPESLIANLMWFFKAKDFKDLAQLKEISQEV